MCGIKTYYFITKKGIIVKHLVIFFVEIYVVPTSVRRREHPLPPKFDLPKANQSISIVFAATPSRGSSLAPAGQFTFCAWQKYLAPCAPRAHTPVTNVTGARGSTAQPRRSPLHIPRFRLPAKARSFRGSSSPHRNHFVGFRRGPLWDDLHRRRRRGHTQASSRHATPGSSLPSRNSREAPPPVEMWVILSA